MVEMALLSARLVTNTNVRRFSPAVFSSAPNDRPAACANGFSFLMESYGSNAFLGAVQRFVTTISGQNIEAHSLAASRSSLEPSCSSYLPSRC